VDNPTKAGDEVAVAEAEVEDAAAEQERLNEKLQEVNGDLVRTEYENRLSQLEELVAEEVRDVEAELEEESKISKILDAFSDGTVVPGIIRQWIEN